MTKYKKFSQMPSNKNIILGIDPGYGRIGIAIIEKTKNGDNLLHSECFETDSKLPHHKRLLKIGEKISRIISKYKPKKIAIETLLWSKNKKTALQVAEARGVILLEAARWGIIVCEHNPNQIKVAVTGYGKSDKNQIISMVEKLIKLPVLPKKQKRLDDEYDAIAAALTCSAISLSTEVSV
jgi:crossover junction endodeoxyribonuclease RuvC